MATMDVKDVIGDNLAKIIEAATGKKRHAELAEVCVRENRITTLGDAAFRRIAGLSLFSVTAVSSAALSPAHLHLGVLGILYNASMFGFLQGCFHQ